jgi:hypothetical protein
MSKDAEEHRIAGEAFEHRGRRDGGVGVEEPLKMGG